MFEIFDKCLEKVDSDDYWSDQGILEAEDIVEKFEDNDWLLLNTTVVKKNKRWILRCVEVLGEGETERHIQSLMMIFKSQTDIEIREEAIESVVDLMNRIPLSSSITDCLKEMINLVKDPSIIITQKIKLIKAEISGD